MNTTECIIPPNPDIAGFGIRISIYLLALLTLLPNAIDSAEHTVQNSRLLGTFMNEDRRIRLHPLSHLQKILQSDNEVFGKGDVRMTMLFLGVALTVSMIVQARTVGLSVYYALVVINLCLVTINSLVPSSTQNLRKPRYEGDPVLSSERIHLYLDTYLSFVGGVMLWISVTLKTFDTTHPNCTTFTKYDILGGQIGADTPALFMIILIISTFFLIPFVNILTPYVTYVVFILTITVAIWMLLMPIRYFKRAVIGLDRLGGLSRAISMALPDFLVVLISLAILSPTVVMIFTTERTVAINNVGNGNNNWTVSQTTFLFISAIPFLKIALRGLSKCHRNISEYISNAKIGSKRDRIDSVKRGVVAILCTPKICKPEMEESSVALENDGKFGIL
ncbi:hypothetical protein BD410DRAFT_275058 [Rickenella mellea]|uniref:Uncharacterized protein n=1 Tax=Rickenella mellea TaxID=50990 RepID=A0A4Y7Q3P3_9AGAM|nr:hypothetical protein BD410DRAFT_275058 [Rickenella mellea]